MEHAKKYSPFENFSTFVLFFFSREAINHPWNITRHTKPPKVFNGGIFLLFAGPLGAYYQGKLAI